MVHFAGSVQAAGKVHFAGRVQAACKVHFAGRVQAAGRGSPDFPSSHGAKTNCITFR